jgi:Tfp pilus assembly protein PilN
MRAVNLIPADQREGAGSLAGRSGGAALIVLGLIAGLAILAVLYGSAHRSASKSHAELTTVDAELAVARAQVGRAAPYTSFIAMADQRVQAVSQLAAARFDWSHAFDELGRVLPRDASLTDLHGVVGTGAEGSAAPASGATASGAATPTSATPPGSTPVFTIAGCAASQSEVAHTLQRLRLIDGVAEVTLQNSEKSARAGSGGAGASASSGCGAGTAVFNATIDFAPLPSAPVAGAPGSSPGAGTAAAAAPAGAQAVTVSSQGGVSR